MMGLYFANIYNIYTVSLLTILQTQTADYCIKYILNSDFQFTDEEQSTTMDMVKYING